MLYIEILVHPIVRYDDTHPVLSLIALFFLPDVLCDSTDLIWRKGTPFEAMTGRTATSSEVTSAVRQMPGDLATVPSFTLLADRRDTRGKWH